MDEIRIENLNLYAYHGVYEEEQKNGQNFFVNLTLYTDTQKAGKSDDLSLSIDYGQVCLFIAKWMKEHTYKLLEAVAENLSEAILLQFPLAREIDFEICKPEAPIPLPFENVSVRIRRGWHPVYLSVGSNMGNRSGYLKLAYDELNQNSRIRNLKSSSVLETKPYGGVEQDDFMNAVFALDTMLTPAELLEELHRIEQMAHRERKIHWGPRTLDLDILLYDKLIYEDENLIIPHVDMENREFVLKPLCELAPNYRHPILQKTIKQLLDGLQTE